MESTSNELYFSAQPEEALLAKFCGVRHRRTHTDKVCADNLVAYSEKKVRSLAILSSVPASTPGDCWSRSTMAWLCPVPDIQCAASLIRV